MSYFFGAVGQWGPIELQTPEASVNVLGRLPELDSEKTPYT